MFETQNLLLFIISGFLLNITPGADTLYILGRSGTQGFRGGAVAAMGIGAGCFVHIVAATAGLSALLVASATAFSVIKFVGAAYLVYIGFSLLRSSSAAITDIKSLPVTNLRSIFWQGFLTNALNPKVALFFLAFLPQFIATDAVHKSLALFFLGILFNINGTIWNVFVAWASSQLMQQLKRSGSITQWFNKTIGGLFVFLGIKLAISHS